MAEGGGERDGSDNPFSFKKFMKKQSSTDRNDQRNQRRQDPDLFANQPVEEDPGNRQQEDNELQHNEVTSSTKNKREKDDQNPFSFRKFLQGQSGGARPKTNAGQITTFDLANDLPDFVQEAPEVSHSHDHRTHKPDVPLPDFAIDTEASHLHASGLGAGSASDSDILHSDLDLFPADNQPKNYNGLLQHDLVDSSLPHLDHGELDFLCASGGLPGPNLQDNLGDLPLDDPIVNGAHVPDLSHSVQDLSHQGSSLPDFLPDSVLGHQHSSLEAEFDSGDDLNGLDSVVSLQNQLDRLRDENRSLRAELEEARQNSDSMSERLQQTMKQMEHNKKQEEEETAALEAAVHKVGENLEVTMARAVKAESVVAKLEQEKASLQKRVLALEQERELLQQGGQQSDIVKEKTRYASDQLASAARAAETSLKDLMKGVDQLKLISDILASVDKVTENSPDSNQDNSDQATGS